MILTCRKVVNSRQSILNCLHQHLFLFFWPVHWSVWWALWSLCACFLFSVCVRFFFMSKNVELPLWTKINNTLCNILSVDTIHWDACPCSFIYSRSFLSSLWCGYIPRSLRNWLYSESRPHTHTQLLIAIVQVLICDKVAFFAVIFLDIVKGNVPLEVGLMYRPGEEFPML